jgi:hypothetical protein
VVERGRVPDTEATTRHLKEPNRGVERPENAEVSVEQALAYLDNVDYTRIATAVFFWF